MESGTAAVSATPAISAVAKLPVLVRFVPLFCASELTVFATHDKNHSNGSERGRNNQNQNPALQCVNHSSSGRSGLRVTQRAALRKSRNGGSEQDDQSQPCQSKVWFASHLVISLSQAYKTRGKRSFAKIIFKSRCTTNSGPCPSPDTAGCGSCQSKYSSWLRAQKAWCQR
jgi:hypothetical protein